ncbi:hypothetical protein ABDK00_013550 [Niabella insulamsoli]|uniref:hypothetical protein n=1 Tax=Niabella insulamsoli TaxID=3144874 RepID=UPI0031FD7C37
MISGAAFAQSGIPATPTTELYGYYKKGESLETVKFMAEEYEALLARQSFRFLRTNVVSDKDYKLDWSKKYEGSLLQARIHYQFLVPFFKITIEEINVIFSNGDTLYITKNLKDKAVKKQFNSLYEMLVHTLVKLIEPAKTITKEQLREALENIDKIPANHSK